jgi:hypothetical protein
MFLRLALVEASHGHKTSLFLTVLARSCECVGGYLLSTSAHAPRCQKKKPAFPSYIILITSDLYSVGESCEPMFTWKYLTLLRTFRSVRTAARHWSASDVAGLKHLSCDGPDKRPTPHSYSMREGPIGTHYQCNSGCNNGCEHVRPSPYVRWHGARWMD